MAIASFDTAQYSTALEQLELLSKEYKKDAEINYYLARSYFKDQQFDEARDLLEQNVDQFPDHADSHFLRGSARLNLVSDVSFFSKPGLVKSALKSWQSAVAVDGEHLEGRYAVASFLLNAPRIVGGNKKQGKVELAALREISEPYYLLVKAAESAKDQHIEEAVAGVKLAIKDIPDRAFPTLILANYYLMQEKHQEALSTVDAYRQRHKQWNDPGESQTAFLTGKIYASLEDKTTAREQYELALDFRPTNNIRQQIVKAIDDL